MIDPVDLPAGFYARRQVVSDQLAACLLLRPAWCPSRDEFPRDDVSCDSLRDVMALTIFSAGNSVRLAKMIKDKLGAKYLCRLVDLCHPSARGNFVLIGYYALYVAQLREMERIAREHESALRVVRGLQSRCVHFSEFRS